MEYMGFDFDYDSQMDAISALLYRLAEADVNLAINIENTRKIASHSSGDANESAVEQWVDLMHASIYQDAAHSMAAVGMLAPVIESVFKNAFLKIGAELPRGDLVKGIEATAKRVGLAPYLPYELTLTLEALFEYRNKMFHYGFEWPPNESRKFDNRLSDWPTGWFEKATVDDKPWMFYMTPEFIQHCLIIIRICIDEIDHFLSDNITTGE